MPKSRKRKKATYVPPVSQDDTPKKSPQWYVTTMLVLMGVGVAWVVTTYITETRWPIGALGQWNLAVGFVLLIAGFGMTTRWK